MRVISISSPFFVARRFASFNQPEEPTAVVAGPRLAGRTTVLILALLVLVIGVGAFFNWQRSLRETRSSAEAAPTSGRFVKISDGEIYIQETGAVSVFDQTLKKTVVVTAGHSYLARAA